MSSRTGCWKATAREDPAKSPLLAQSDLFFAATHRPRAKLRLSIDSLPGAKKSATALTDAVRAARAHGEVAAAAEAWDELARQLLEHGAGVSASMSLAQAREAFNPLSHAAVKLLQHFGNPTAEAIRLAHCPMAANDAGASWVQREATVANAYFGAEMPTCGEVRATLEPGEYLPAHFAEPAR